MIEPVNIVLLIVYGIFVPVALGMLGTRRLRHYEASLAMAAITGLVFMMALFELLAVPMILMKQPFHLLVIIWKIVIWCLVAISIVLNLKRFFSLVKDKLLAVKNFTLTEVFIWISVLFLVALQIYMPVGHMRTDTDDARFVAEAMEAYELDTMLQYHPITGEFVGEAIGEMQKDVASPFPMFMALGGAVFHLPPAISTHIFFPLLFIVFAYIVYYLLGHYFTGGNQKYTGLFLFFLSLLHCFAYESIYAAGYTLLAVIWQGRSVLAMVILPYIWLLLMRVMDSKEAGIKYYILLLCAIIAGLLTSSMAIELIPILVGAYSLIIAIKNKKVKPIVMMFLLLIPCAVCFSIYR